MWEYKVGHVIDVLRTLPSESVQMVVTSPPYWGLRKYSGEQEITWPDGWKGGYGLEPTIELYVEHTVQILREIKRVLRKDGVVFWNIGDSYSGSGGAGGDYNEGGLREGQPKYPGRCPLKPKDLCLIPFRVALAVQADGWWVRQDIIWHKPNPMPESCTDRPTKSHEYIFLFTKSKDYYWDQEAVRDGLSDGPKGGRQRAADKGETASRSKDYHNGRLMRLSAGKDPPSRNIRSVWTIATQPYSEAHFATFPEEIPRRCILAGTSQKGNCPKCGMPWIRMTEITGKTLQRNGPGTGQKVKACHEHLGATSSLVSGYVNTTRTVGWTPQCQCNLEPVPAIVLDPFCGSGTTLRVARDLGRDAIGIDICNQYKEMAEKRADLNIPDITKFGEQIS